jgi:hypothetical protein
MTHLISPGVSVREIDLTTIVPAVSTTEAAFAGVFHWGPMEKVQLIDSENNLAKWYGKPTNYNPETWFTAASFLGYGNRLYVSRAGDTTGNTVSKTFTGNSTNLALESGNTFVNLGNTTGITVGMVLLYSNTTALPGASGIKVATLANATHITVDTAPTANVESAEFMFRDDVIYSAAALQSDLNYNAGDVTDWDNMVIKSDDHYDARESNGDTWDLASLYVAKYPGDIGNSIRVSVCDTAAQYSTFANLTPNAQFDSASSNVAASVGSNTLTVTISPLDTGNTTEVTTANDYAAAVYALMSVGDLVEVGNTRLGFQYLKVTSIGTLTNTSNVFSFALTMDDEYKLAADISMGYLQRYWEFFNSADTAPGQSDYVLQFGNTSANDELHIIVVDEGGKITGSPGEILETWRSVSRATDAKGPSGETIYYKNVINDQSQYLWWVNDRTTAYSNTAALISSGTGTVPLNMRMVGGGDGPNEANVAFADLAFAYDLYRSKEDIEDIGIVLQGKARGLGPSNYTQLANYIIDNISESRKDCVAVISPDKADVVNNIGGEADDVVAFRNSARNTSYAFMDSGYKYMYDKYNDVYRWVPLNGDIGGLMVRTDLTNDAWWSPAGLNRGTIKNIVRLAWNPRQAQRDTLYKAGVNPVISKAGEGTYLFGDKTLLSKPSAFDRINVRRLFIVLEKAISRAARYTLFEFNDDFTRAQFRNLVNPYLRDVQGRRGITDFLVVCDARNNTAEVINRNEFVGDIYIRPNYSINFIHLNFIAVKNGISFNEVLINR